MRPPCGKNWPPRRNAPTPARKASGLAPSRPVSSRVLLMGVSLGLALFALALAVVGQAQDRFEVGQPPPPVGAHQLPEPLGDAAVQPLQPRERGVGAEALAVMF